MTDWNPVEILGRNPSHLANSLFKALISSDTWSEARVQMGYGSNDKDLCFEFKGNLYVRLIKSLKSVFPSEVEPKVVESIINRQIDQIKNGDARHDRVEFDLIGTQFPLSSELLSDQLTELGLGKPETSNLYNTLKSHAYHLVTNFEVPAWDNFLRSEEVDLNLLRIISLQFCMAARHSFIVRRWIEESGAGSHKTGCSDLLEKLALYGRIQFNRVLRLSGVHTFWQKEYGFEISSQATKIETKDFPSEIENLLKDEVKRHIEYIVSSSGLKTLGIGKACLENYFLSALSSREVGKRVLFIQLTKWFIKIQSQAQEIGLDTTVLQALSVDEILNLKTLSANTWTEIAYIRQRKRLLDRQVFCPDLIREGKDIVFEMSKSGDFGHYIGRGILRGKVMTLQEIRTLSLTECENIILLIQRGEPGLDWVFGLPIKGIVTEVGGPNSHVAIQCFERQLHGLLGIGTLAFESIRNTHRCIEIDAENKCWRPVDET